MWIGSHDFDPDLAETLEVVQVQAPLKFDIITACGMQLESRHEVCQWDVRQSDVSGCVQLFNRQPLSSLVTDLISRQAPVLSLVDALQQAGFVGVDSAIDHRPGRQVFDCMRLVGRRAYLQCVLYQEKVWAKPVGQFSSIGSQAFFDALLRCAGPVKTGLAAKAYQRMLAAEAGDHAALALLGEDPPTPGLAEAKAGGGACDSSGTTFAR